MSLIFRGSGTLGTMRLAVLLLVLICFVAVSALDEQSEVYDVVEAEVSDVHRTTENATRYYCIFRNLWTAERHPRGYPEGARWSDIALVSGQREFLPWTDGRAVSRGIEVLAENGVTQELSREVGLAGDFTLQYNEGGGFAVDPLEEPNNFAFIDPVEVSSSYSFLISVAAMQPSPDWISGFYQLDMVDVDTQMYIQRFKLRLHPWDTGTDSGQSYLAPDMDQDPPHPSERITVQKAPSSGAYLSPDGSQVLPVAEMECVLHTCPRDTPDCVKENFPPTNRCDVLKFPTCASYCDPSVAPVCERCVGNALEPDVVFLPGCCESGHEQVAGPACSQSSTPPAQPTMAPVTQRPTSGPSASPVVAPSTTPIRAPTNGPTVVQTQSPSQPSISVATGSPVTGAPSNAPTNAPVAGPTAVSTTSTSGTASPRLAWTALLGVVASAIVLR